jgi:hypothetical protein
MNRLECYQAASVAFNTHVCGGVAGRAKTDTVYQTIVEGRDVPSSYEDYSSCADRCHAWLWRLGCRLPFLNREERTPLPKDFKWGVNISNLHDLSLGAPCLRVTTAKGQTLPVPPAKDWEPSPGDELLLWNTGYDAHSNAIVSFNGALAVTANYGSSGCSKAVFPGGKLSQPTPLQLRGGRWWYGNGVHAKQVMRVLRLVDYIEVLTAKASLDGIPFDDRYIGETRDLIEAERA